MAIVKRLYIKANNNYDSDFQIVPVNTNQPLEIDSDIGIFKLFVNIKSFDGAKQHLSNSLRNEGEETFLNGEKIDFTHPNGKTEDPIPNLRISVEFTPKEDIPGGDLIFGNDFTYSIKDYVPTTLLNTGLKLFNWFVNDTVKGDVYNEKPYLYGLALNSFSYIGIGKLNPPGIVNNKSHPMNYKENLNQELKDVPEDSNGRKKFFNTKEKCDKFTFQKGKEYDFRFDTDFLKLADSKYLVSIPKFDLDVSRYANDTLNNVNWVIKQKGYDGVGEGKLGLIINFALSTEDDKD
ncbi:DUF1769 domain-containing protein [Acetobacter pasteurianus]|uniref:Domain of unknown function at the cortex 1 domain-containing protein n=1 Tax=Lodderomyces elongisporus (strain ATCC 11503 / CBS 2605 / JCM 1781 / NBRC 1676 / NRRL YB-4239) TaxID=379508 RepID=A5DSH0_LODEL|nr:uncharacterized protein PVL30_000297 [Lodderomyces elongisporus]EDK42128.1 conserved hypothetical protein [Lodderomyces elongisporus NRRL YB-4239]MDC6270907.1 DUF1769 domain-containing protein [Acetobacter pasteurianus]WLF76595.1 hypothetical protein PVL30_000297 [Lodderomyces elongisporus]